jgi:hypothetical protein
MQAFDGLGPEVTNSRLAMLGFAIAAFWELTQGIDVFEQIKRYPLITVATFVIFTVASWIPFLQGQSYNVKSGPFTPSVSLCCEVPLCLYCRCVSSCSNHVNHPLSRCFEATTGGPCLARCLCCRWHLRSLQGIGKQCTAECRLH